MSRRAASSQPPLPSGPLPGGPLPDDVARLAHIDPAISERCGVVPWGVRGMAVLRGGCCLRHFTQHATPLENWRAAVAWALANPQAAPELRIDVQYEVAHG